MRLTTLLLIALLPAVAVAQDSVTVAVPQDRNCSDFASQQDAQGWYDAIKLITGQPDAHELDADGDGQPASYSDATSDNGSGGNALGETAIGSADFTKADGDTSGRKVTVAAQSGISVDVDGTADHVAIIDDTNTTLKLVTTLSSSQSVSAGGTMDTDAFDEEIEDPA